MPEKSGDQFFCLKLLHSIDLTTYMRAYTFLSDAFLLYNQATIAFDARAFPAACLMCRSTLEAASYLFLTREKNPEGLTTYTPMTLDGEYRNVYTRELRRGIKKADVLSEEQLNNIHRIIEHGNVIAHLAERNDRQALSLIRSKVYLAPVEQLWLNEKDAVKDLEDTM